MATGGAVVVGYKAGSMVSRAVPTWAIGGAARMIGTGVAALVRGRRDVVAANLRRVVGDRVDERSLNRSVDRVFAYYMHYWMESFKLPWIPAPQLARHMSSDGFEHVTAAIDERRGVILALPHLGSWDYAGAWMASIGYPMTVVVEPLEPRELFEWFAELRRSLGLTVVPTGPEAAPAVLRALRSARAVGLLADRDLSGNGVEVRFFGERTTLPAGPAMLALRTGSALLPTGVYTLERGQHLSLVRPPISLERTGSLRDDVRRVTQDLASELEYLIKRAPEQWHMLQPVWPLRDRNGSGP